MNNTFTRIAHIFKKALAKRGMDVRFFGVLGQPPFTEDTVLTGTSGIVYVTDSVTGIVRQVLNRRVQNKVFEHVAVGYDPSQPGVLQVLYARDVFGDQDKSPAVPDHAETHAEDGGDTDYVSGGRIKPFLVLPYSGFTVQVFGGLFVKGDHSQGVLANQLVDLSAFQPAAGAKWILLEYADDGTISVVEGDTVDTVGVLNVSDVPTATYKPLQDIKLYDGQEKIRRDIEIDDFADPRFGWAGHTDESEYDFIQFDIDAVYAEVAGRMGWNAGEYTVNIVTGLGPVLQVGQEIYLLVYNDTVSQIDNLTPLRPRTATVIGGEIVIVPELAQADTWEHCEGTLMVATMDIPPSSIGLATRFGRARGGDTSGFSAPGVGLFLSGAVSGTLEETQPNFPHFSISMGGLLAKDALDGEIFVTITRDIFDTTLNFWNGTFRESFDFRVDSDGATVTGSLEPTNGHDDMTMIFSDGFTLLDTSPAATIALTPGSDTNPQLNYIYIPKSTKVLTVSTSDWPTAEHIRVATVILKTAATVQATGASKDHNWNDHIASTDTFQGHLSHMGAAFREKLDATWKAGAQATLTLDAAPSPDDLYISVTGGKVKQLHDQIFPQFDMTQYSIDAVSTGSKTFTVSDDGDLSSIFPAGRIIQVNNSTGNDRLYTIASILWSDPDFIITVEETIPDATADGTIGDDIDVVNDSVAAFKSILNLNEITLDADGDTINNKWFSVVFWGVANKSGEPSQLMLNLPTGSYNTEALAVTDANNYSIYDIPADYKGTGFLIARFTVKKATNVWTYNSGVGYHDLRGKVPNATVGGGGGGGGGATTFLALTDAPASYASQALKLLRVNAGETATEFAELGADIINALTGKTTPVDADELVLADSAASNVAKKLTWANLKATLKTYFDTLYLGGSGAVPHGAGGRVTLVSGTPVMGTEQAAKTDIFYTPYMGDLVPIYDGAWTEETFAEITLALDSDAGHTGYHQSGKNFTLYIVDDSGTLRLCSGPAWADDTTETAWEYVNGIKMNSGAITVRFGTGAADTIALDANRGTIVGCFRASANGTTTWELGGDAAGGDPGKLYLWNEYNRRLVSIGVYDTTNSWPYSTPTYRAKNAAVAGGVGNRVSFIRGDNDEGISAINSILVGQTAVGALRWGIMLDNTNNFTVNAQVNGTAAVMAPAVYSDNPSAGFHFLQAVEFAHGVGSTATWFGDNSGFIRAGLTFQGMF